MYFSNPSKQELWLYASLALTIGAVAWLVAEMIQGTDMELFNEAINAIGLSNGSTIAGHAVHHIANFTENFSLWITLSLFCLAGFAAGFKIDGNTKFFAWIQLLVASILFQLAAWFTFHAIGHPIGIATAFTFGIFGGSFFKLLANYRQKQQEQFYSLLLRNKELQEARMQMVKQDETERRILAADLHDQVLNDLKTLKQKIDRYKTARDEKTSEEIESLLQQAMNEIRDVMDNLCPSALEHLGLIAAIEDCIQKGAERANVKFRFKNTVKIEELDALTMVEKSLLYRMVQESITNICKHAEAKHIRSNTEVKNDELVIAITDDGKGIQPGTIRSDSRGIRYIKQRADLIGANVSWLPGEEGHGTTVEIRLNFSARKSRQ